MLKNYKQRVTVFNDCQYRNDYYYLSGFANNTAKTETTF